MAQKTKAQILAEIASLLADNTTGDISAQDVRTVVNDITDSYEDIITAGTTSQYWRGDKTWQTFPILEVTGTLTAAQINALDTTPITILGAAGANKFYVIDSFTIHFKAGTSIFTGSYDLLLFFETANEDIMTVATKSELQSTTDKITTAFNTSNYSGVGTPFTNAIINKAVKLKTNYAISGGDGTINFSIKYRIVTTS